tara:strand:+ start:111 stop:314 length:204 start_codon:yes stop_codon:yes gene_type:complete
MKRDLVASLKVKRSGKLEMVKSQVADSKRSSQPKFGSSDENSHSISSCEPDLLKESEHQYCKSVPIS